MHGETGGILPCQLLLVLLSLRRLEFVKEASKAVRNVDAAFLHQLEQPHDGRLLSDVRILVLQDLGHGRKLLCLLFGSELLFALDIVLGGIVLALRSREKGSSRKRRNVGLAIEVQDHGIFAATVLHRNGKVFGVAILGVYDILEPAGLRFFKRLPDVVSTPTVDTLGIRMARLIFQRRPRSRPDSTLGIAPSGGFVGPVRRSPSISLLVLHPTFLVVGNGSPKSHDSLLRAVVIVWGVWKEAGVEILRVNV
ncbi:hypothetical protein LZ32DRAFT_684242 [Colletotrichum eremochloae]|nr:hypothetical protein LZ32DRAFT_684242 [Colletotrichum eremochloae]